MVDHLTKLYSENLSKQIERSLPGMAHFAGTGPAGKTCGGCDNHSYTDEDGRKFTNCCRKFRKLMHHDGPQIPPETSACRYFEDR